MAIGKLTAGSTQKQKLDDVEVKKDAQGKPSDEMGFPKRQRTKGPAPYEKAEPPSKFNSEPKLGRASLKQSDFGILVDQDVYIKAIYETHDLMEAKTEAIKCGKDFCVVKGVQNNNGSEIITYYVMPAKVPHVNERLKVSDRSESRSWEVIWVNE